MTIEEIILNKNSTIDKLEALYDNNYISNMDLKRYSKKIGKYIKLAKRGINLQLKIKKSNHLVIYKPDGESIYIVKNSELLLFFKETKNGEFLLENLELIKMPIEHLVKRSLPLILKLLKLIEKGKTVGLGIHPSSDFETSFNIELKIAIRRNKFHSKIITVMTNINEPQTIH